MRCPSCGFVSFDHLTSCKKCGKDLPPPPGGRRIPAPAAGPPPTGRPAAPAPGGDRGAERMLTGPEGPTPAAPSTPDEGSLHFTLPAAVTAPSGGDYDLVPEADFTLDFRPAGFWIRFVATLVDSILLFVLMLAIAVPIGLSAGITAALADPMGMAHLLASLGAAFTAITFLLPMLYEVVFVGWRGQTPGKILLKLKIIRTDGGEVDYVKAFIRWIGKLVSGFTLLIGYLIAAFTTNKRALHDFIAGTRVIHL